MDRRNALRNMGLSLGYVIATPTLISLVQSCKNENVIAWTPDFFTLEEGQVLTHLVDIILPKSDTPSASEVNTHIFIDRFANEVMEKKQQDFLKMSMGKFIDKTLKDSGKKSAGNLTPEDLEPVLAEALKLTKEDQVKNYALITSYNEAMDGGNPTELDEVAARFGFANSVRGLTILGYKTSEFVGENVLDYLPIPGEYIACGDVQELTGGKAWSL